MIPCVDAHVADGGNQYFCRRYAAYDRWPVTVVWIVNGEAADEHAVPALLREPLKAALMAELLKGPTP